MLPFDIDFKKPDYQKVYYQRLQRLLAVRANPRLLPQLHYYYKHNIAQFIIDWGCTSDPRNIQKGLPVNVPFLLFDKQIEFVNALVDHWQNQKPLIVEKSRDMGVTWLCVAVFCSLAIFNKNVSFGFGSRKELYVDKIGDMDSILEKARFFLETLPKEFNGGWNKYKNSKYMLLTIPQSGSYIKGEAGDQIGRGGRTSGYCIDEHAHIERAELIEASLSQTTNFRVDVSTPFGMGNIFAQKRFSGKYDVFPFHWTDDPRKDRDWYENQCNILDPVTVAQEIDLDYSGSVEGIVIPPAWVLAAVDAHIKLGIDKSGEKYAALDLADEGKDLNALCIRHGVVLEHIEEWSGKNSDMYETAEKAIPIVHQFGCRTLYYDAEGLGVSLRGDAKRVQSEKGTKIILYPFRGSGEVYKPELKVDGKIRNIDAFANRKAHAWWLLRHRFNVTYRYVTKGIPCEPDEIISLPSTLKNLHKIKLELSQPTYTKNSSGKIIINKKPDGALSPNIADAIMMCYQNDHIAIKIHSNAIKLFSG